MNIFNRIRELRKQHDITQASLAEIAGVSLPSIQRLEAGKETIRLDVLIKVTDALGYQVSLEPKVDRHE